MANEIEIYKNNSKTIITTVSGLDSLSGYTAVFTVKDSLDDTLLLIGNTGTTNGTTITFQLLPEETDIDADNYNYDITISNNINNYTVMQSVLTIKDSVKWG